ncbi:MAG: DNA recombination protein RmuC [Deltaproteobacteria bacterium]|nr:DNA recombination protein RmuC [Deltaproteobacteria bacterium]
MFYISIGLAVGLAVASVVLVVFLFYRRQHQQNQNQQNAFLLFQQQLEGMRDQVTRSLENVTGQVATRIDKHNELLAQTHDNLGQRLDNAAKVVGQVQGKLGQLEEASQKIFEVGKDIGSLKEILQAPKLRGNLGEFFLGELLGQIFTKDQYELQYRFKSGESVDAIIKLSGWFVPVDSKFPLECFMRYLEEQHEPQKRNLKKLFVTEVKKQIDKIAEKYILPAEGTSEFALMYIPAENVYYEIIVKDELSEGKLYHYAMKKKVIPVSPNNLYIYLHTILLGLKGLTVERRAKEIMASINSLKNEFGKVAEAARKLGGHLNNARSAHEEMGDRMNHLGNKMDRLQASDPEKKEETVLTTEEEPLMLN